MKAGETAEVIRHSITLSCGKSFELFQEPEASCTIESFREAIKKAKQTIYMAALWFPDIYGEVHTFYIKDVAKHSMKMVKVTLKAADPNPLNHNYGEDEIT